MRLGAPLKLRLYDNFLWPQCSCVCMRRNFICSWYICSIGLDWIGLNWRPRLEHEIRRCSNIFAKRRGLLFCVFHERDILVMYVWTNESTHDFYYHLLVDVDGKLRSLICGIVCGPWYIRPWIHNGADIHILCPCMGFGPEHLCFV